MLKKGYNNLFYRLVFLVLFLVFIFVSSTKKFDLVKAYSNKINIFPGEFLNVQTESKYFWENINYTFYQDLSPTAEFSEFNNLNSAYILIGAELPKIGTGSVPFIIENNAKNQSDSEMSTDNQDGKIMGVEENVINVEAPAQKKINDLEIENENSVSTGTKEQDLIPLENSEKINRETQPEEKDVIYKTDEILESKTEPVEKNDETIDTDDQVGLLSNKIWKKINNFFSLKSARAQNEDKNTSSTLEIIELDNKKPIKTKKSVIFSDFTVPDDFGIDDIGKVALRMSMAAYSEISGDVLEIEYNTGDEWYILESLKIEKEISNNLQGDYFSFELPSFDSVTDFEKLNVKVSYLSENIENEGKKTKIFLDSLWLEIDYNEEKSVENLTEEIFQENKKFEISLLSNKRDFKMDDAPKFNFKYKRVKDNLIDKIGSNILNIFRDEYKNIKIKAKTKDSHQNGLNELLKINYINNGEFEISMMGGRQFKPGLYEILIDIEDEGNFYSYVQDFSWGVLAMNTNKSIYMSGEEAYLQMAVLDNFGHTICDANLSMEVTSPDGGIAYLSSDNGLVINNPECGPDNVIENPDYFAFYGVGAIGNYSVKLIASTTNGIYEIRDSFEVRDYVPFEIERVGPTRIYPPADYKIFLRIKSNVDYKGDLIDYVPSNFRIVNGDGAEIDHQEDYTRLRWKVNWYAGETHEFEYIFDAPDISPEFYLLGPAIAGDFEEIRKWQIASDAETVYDVNTGIYADSNWTNPQYAWNSQNDNYAIYTYPKSGAGGSSYYLQASSTNITNLGTIITKVEIGIEGYCENSDVNANLIPYFNGTAGATYEVAKTLLGSSDSQSTFWRNITADSNGPGASNWTWANVQSLAVRVWGDNDSNSRARKLYVDQLRIRVTHEPANNKPTGSFNSAVQKKNGSGVVDISIEVDDPDDNDARAKIEYVAGSACVFSPGNDPTLDATDANITADFGDPAIDNNYAYQVGTSTAWIKTASGTNSVFFDWQSKTNIPSADGTYCLRLTVNDGSDDQAVSATTTLTVDNTAPTNPGSLTNPVVTGTTVTFDFGATSTDTNFYEYKIFYKEGTSGVTELDNVFSSSSDANLGNVLYNGAATTTVTNLFPGTQYVFNIWAYDEYGNKASGTIEVLATTTDQSVPPIGSINSISQKKDGSGVVDISIEVDDGNNDDCRAKIEYEEGDSCLFLLPLDPYLDETDSNITADFGDPDIDNNYIYQVGTSTAWIETAPGSNTVLFDWITRPDLTDADGQYCVKLTVNDNDADQSPYETAIVTIDNVAPTPPGAMTAESVGTNVILTFGDSTTETNFFEYKIFYKQGSFGVTEDDLMHASNTDANLGFQNYNGASSTTVSGLFAKKEYVFNIWAYDEYGNVSSSTEVTVTTGDADPIRAKTVIFEAGIFSGNGTTGQNSDTNLNFSSFNFSLAEAGASIENAYIIFEPVFEAYNDNSGNYTGYNLAFDACVENCTANAFTGTGRVLKDDNTVLAYDETESNQARLILDVTNEAQLASYAGGGVNLEGQVGYRIERGAAVNSIASSKALLVITYTYNENNVTSLTNTVVYPLESTYSGDSGTRRLVQPSTCILSPNPSSNCPLFSYNMNIAELGTRKSYWYQTYMMNYDNNQSRSDDVIVNVNVEGVNINSNSFIHERANQGTQGTSPAMHFTPVSGFAENTSQTLEFSAQSTNNVYYMIGGEVFETYTAPSSATTKTRTVSFPIGVINNGGTTAETSKSINIYFPENGNATGTVSIKKAWVRFQSSNYISGNSTLTIASKIGDNTKGNTIIYSYDPGPVTIKPSFKIIYVIPSAQYSEMQKANKTTAKNITVYTTNSTSNQGGISAELMITYTYTDESNGYLNTINLFAGQSDTAGNSQNVTVSTADMVVPELVGINTIRGGSIMASYLLSDSDGAMPGGNALFDARISTSTPICSNSYTSGTDSINAFTEYYNDALSSLVAIDGQSYTACYSNNGAGDTSAGAKMAGYLIYTYQHDAPEPTYTQNDWRWYGNIDNVLPTTAKAAENATLSNVNIADILRLRMNIGITEENLSTSTQGFTLQYGEGSDCTAVSSWKNVGAVGSSEPWRGYNNSSVADGAASSSVLLSTSDKFESYEESNNSVFNTKYLSIGDYGEWDWVIYNNSATSSTDYCFRMIKDIGTSLDVYNSDGYPKIKTAPTNTKPTNPANLGQYKNNETTVIANQGWTNQSNVKLRAKVTDPNVSESVSLYFEFIDGSDTFTTATSVPAGACAYGTAFGSCGSGIWAMTSATGDYRTNAYTATTSITAIPESVNHYKWQVMACDDDGYCSSWVKFGPSPNIKFDLTAPTPPGNLTEDSISATSITYAYGASTTEENFVEYKIFYKIGSSNVTELDFEHNPAELDYQDYNGLSTSTKGGLSAGTQYVMNIWAYDIAGNKASGTTELVFTTTSSFTPPTGQIFLVNQKDDGSGTIDISLLVDDADNDDTLRAKIEYVAGAACDFSTPLDPTLDETDANITATYGDPAIDNNSEYQVGTSSPSNSWIMTSPGSNFVFFDWLSKSDIPGVNATYCLRLTVNDGTSDQDPPFDTQLILIDNLAPTPPGNLTEESKDSTSVTLHFGGQSFDSRFDRYRIFYATSSPVLDDGSDYEHIDTDLNSINYGGTSTTTVSGLLMGTEYYFKIWAYDDFGNKSSSTELMVKTNGQPTNLTINGQYKSDELTTIANGEWITENEVRLSAKANDPDTSEILTIYYEFISSSTAFTTDTSEPTGACVYGTNYGDCGSKIWFISSSTPDDYSTNPFIATTSIPSIPDSTQGYKWQVLACDDDGECSSWIKFNPSSPNINIDITPPTAIGALSEYSKTSNTITLSFGATTTDINFTQYKIFYATSSPVLDDGSDYEHTDSNLYFVDYNGESETTVLSLIPDTLYYFKIWAYDKAGNKASSTEISVQTNVVASTPGALFYTKNTRVLYYKTWDGNSWSSEKTGPTLGSASGDNIRHIRTVRSDDGSKIGIFVKTWDGTNQEWWGTVYRSAADDFVNTIQLGNAQNDATNAQLITGCIASLSGGEFITVKNNGASNGTVVHSWNSNDGWVSEGSGPDPAAVVNGCRLVRRTGTDNYVLITFDDTNHGGNKYGDVGTAYYYGGSTYQDSWTIWTEHSTAEEDIDNYVGEAFFDPSDNTRGALNYSNSNNTANAKIKYFMVTDNSINFGVEVTSPTTWTGDFLHGEFAPDPGGVGIAYYAGTDISGEVNVYKINIATATPTWTASTNGDNISASSLYAYTNDSQKPFAPIFYKLGKGIISWNNNSSATPKYRTITASTNTVGASDTEVPGAAANIYTRVRHYKDPNENEFLSVYQNDDVDYAVAFWDGNNDRYYNATDNPGSNQVWSETVVTSGAFSKDDECTSFSFTAGNSAPNAPSLLVQYKSNGSTTIANGGWTNESTVKLKASVSDIDTSEVLSLYLQFVENGTQFATSTVEPATPCTAGTSFTACSGKIWLVATSTLGDYSTLPFTATATITSIDDSSVGYKWQVLGCDDDGDCSSWKKYNAATPNVYVDTVAPTAPGNLTIGSKTSNSVTLNFGASTTEANFSEYRIYYKAGSSGVTTGDTEHNDADLDYKNYNGTSNTTVYNLASTTQYVFNIWAYDLAGNIATATLEIATTTNIGPIINQVSYKFENDDGANVNSNTAAAATDTTLNNIIKGERLNVRIQLENTGGDTATNKIYKLQFENQTDSPGTWTDVGAASQMSYSLGLSGANNDVITSSKAALNSNSWKFGSWHENIGQTPSFSLINGEYTEFVFIVKTNNATLNKTYRFRLYNVTDGKALSSYSKYPTLSVVSAESKKYSKSSVSSLPTTTADLAYYLDPLGYVDVSADDNVDRDNITSSSNIPIANFSTKHSNNTDAISVTWNGQSTTAADSHNIFLQVYRFGSTNAWVNISSNNTAATNTDFTLAGSLNSHLSEYYNGTNWTYWRVYQTSGSHTLKSDYFNISFSTPVPDTSLIHYRWRDDDNSETLATWRENEDVGDPTTGTPLDKGNNVRLRFAISNTGGGAAANYNYRLEMASTTGNCATDPGGWMAVPVTASSEHFVMSTSTNFADGDPTTAQLSSSGYTFTAGDMVEYSSNSSGNISISENYYTEVEYNFKATLNANSGGTYCFKVTNAGTDLDNYNMFAEITLAGVANTAPSFTVSPSDLGSSTSSPTDLGDNIYFSATADDTEGDYYYLAICKTNSILPGNDVAPTCNGGNWCISDLATSSEEAACTYTTATSSEVLPWYAFACDKKAGVGVSKCSVVSQGYNIDPRRDSPFHINHPPIFTSASTTIDNQDPGETIVISTTATDTDTVGGNDNYSLFVCRTNSADQTGCTGGAPDTVCSVLATSTPNAKCSYAVPLPSAASVTPYYAFVFDNHALGAVTNSISDTYTINNTPTVLGNLLLNDGNPINLEMKGTTTKVSTINSSVTDKNGCSTIVSAIAVIYISNATNGFNCTADDNTCYRIGTSNCVMGSCAGQTTSFTCSAELEYFANPTDNSAGNPNWDENWLSYMQVYDGLNYTASSSLGVELLTTKALDIPEPVIDFGSNLYAGDDTGVINSTTTVENIGNCPIDTNISGTNMNGNPSGIIGVGNIEWNLNNFSYSSGVDLTAIGANAGINISKPTDTSGTNGKMYWGIGIPFGSDASVYTGQNTFTALIYESGW